MISPQALTSQNSSEDTLLGVIANVGVYKDARTAGDQFKAQGGFDRESIVADITKASPNVTQIDVQSEAVQIKGTDQAIAFRVRYAIGPTRLLDYRYRLIVGNAVANVIVTAQTSATPGDPSAFRDQAQAIVERQVARLTGARR
jgi:hypothetical protein